MTSTVLRRIIPDIRAHRRKAEKLPQSVRLGTVDIERLWGLSERLGEVADRPISETEAIKGLLFLGEKTDAKKLLALVKDALFESKEALRLQCINNTLAVLLDSGL